MSEHYFSKTPQSNRSPETWQYHLRHNTYQFTSDAGVFSKHSIDFGTALLIESFTRPDVPGDLLDVGCGYGPIGISLAALFTYLLTMRRLLRLTLADTAFLTPASAFLIAFWCA